MLAFGGALVINAGGKDAFVAKLDGETGSAKWATAIGEAGDQEAAAIAVDSAGNAFAVGWFSQDLSCEPECIHSAGGTDGFVGRLDSAGAVAWLVPFGDGGNDRLNAVALDLGGNVVVAGTFTLSPAWGATTLTTSGILDQDLVLAALSPSGEPLWAKDFGDEKIQEATGVAIDAQGRIAVVGATNGVISFPSGGPPPIGDGGARAFSIQLTAAGVPLWARAFGAGSASARASSVRVDGAGHLAIAGSFGGGIDFGHGERSAIGTYDAFLAKLTAAGEPLWAKTFGSKGVANRGVGVAFAPGGQVVMAASIRGTVDFGLGGLSSAGEADIGAAAFWP